MRCKRVRKLVVLQEDKALPKGVLEHLDACEDCMIFIERNKIVRKLIALKRYEQASAEVEERMLYAVRMRIAENAVQTSEGEEMTAWRGTGIPAVRYGLALIVLSLLSIHTMLTPSLPLVQSQLSGPLATQKRVLAERSSPAEPSASSFMSSMRDGMASNNGPSRIQYGTMPSRFVNFDF